MIPTISPISKDTKHALRLWELLVSAYGQSPWTIQQIENDLQRDDIHIWILKATDTKNWLGCLVIQDLTHEAEITQIAIRADQQNKGYGNLLMQILEAIQQPLFLEVRYSQSIAQKLYQKHGFTTIGRRPNYYNNPTEDALIMRRLPHSLK